MEFGYVPSISLVITPSVLTVLQATEKYAFSSQKHVIYTIVRNLLPNVCFDSWNNSIRPLA